MTINPKDAIGTKKSPLSVVPCGVLMEIGLAMFEGARKYGRHNWRAAGISASVYYDACQRHLMAWWEGENIDADSGLSHITKAIATLVVLRDAMMVEKFNDDRPPALADGWIADMNEKASAIVRKHPEAKGDITNGNLSGYGAKLAAHGREMNKLIGDRPFATGDRGQKESSPDNWDAY